MIEIRIMHEASPELLGAFEDVARALENMLERMVMDALRRAVPETPNFTGSPEPARTEPAGRPQAFVDVSSQTAQPAGERNGPAAPAAASSGGGTVWTVERIAYLRVHYPSGAPRAQMLRELRAMPGGTIRDVDHISTYASVQLRLKRPPAVARAASSPIDRGPVEADIDQIRGWAAQRGIPFDGASGLPAVNAKRTELGLGPFVLIRKRARAA